VRYLPRDPHSRFLAKMLLGAVAFHALITTATVATAPLWPESFIVSAQAQLPGLTDAFAHTPRVEALLESGDGAGYPPKTREVRRIKYAVSHLIIAVSLVVTLAGFGLFLIRGIRDASYSQRVRGLVRPEADPVLILVIAILPATIAAGIAAVLYFGFMTEAYRPGRGYTPSDGLVPIWVALIDLQLLCALTLLAGPLHRLLVRRTV
jgi:hypothetical protein